MFFKLIIGFSANRNMGAIALTHPRSIPGEPTACPTPL